MLRALSLYYGALRVLACGMISPTVDTNKLAASLLQTLRRIHQIYCGTAR